MPMHPLTFVAVGMVTAAAIIAGIELFKDSGNRFGYQNEDCFFRYEEEKSELDEKKEKEIVKLLAREKTAQQLLSMGFELLRVEEALRNTESFEDALQYLMVNYTDMETKNVVPPPIKNLSLSEIQNEREAIRKRLEELEEIERKEMFSIKEIVCSDFKDENQPVPVSSQSSLEQKYVANSSLDQPVAFHDSQFEDRPISNKPVFAPDSVSCINERKDEVIFEASPSVAESSHSAGVMHDDLSTKSEPLNVSSPCNAHSIPSILSGDSSSCPSILEEREIEMESAAEISKSICTVYHDSIEEDSSAVGDVRFTLSRNASPLLQPLGVEQPIGDLHYVLKEGGCATSLKSISLADETAKLINEIRAEDPEDGMSIVSASSPSEGWDVVSNQ